MVLNLSNLLIYSCIIAAISCVLIWWYTYHSPWSLQDQHNERSLHEGKTLTGGGLLMFVPINLMGVIIFPSMYLQYVILLLTVVGFVDDKFDISFKVRLAVQVVAALITLHYFSMLNPIALAVFLLIALIWWINLFNFMDGANGMAALHGFVSLVFYGLFFFKNDLTSSYFSYLIISCCLVFVFYLIINMKLKRLFMGDSGSLPMAWVVAILALYSLSSEVLSYLQIAVIHAVFIVDSTLTLLKRLINRENIIQAHATHVYQKLIKQGRSHTKVSAGYAAFTAMCCLLIWMSDGQAIKVQLAIFISIYLTLLVLFMKFLSTAR